MTRILRCYNGYPRFLEHLSYGDLVLHPRVQTSGAGDDGREYLEGHPGGRARRRQLRVGYNELQQRHHRGHTERQLHRPGDNLHEPAGFRGRLGDAAAGRRGGLPRRGLPLRQGARRGPQERRDRRKQLRSSGVRDRELQRTEPGIRESRQLKRHIRCAKSKKLVAGEKEEIPLRRIVDLEDGQCFGTGTAISSETKLKTRHRMSKILLVESAQPRVSLLSFSPLPS